MGSRSDRAGLWGATLTIDRFPNPSPPLPRSKKRLTRGSTKSPGESTGSCARHGPQRETSGGLAPYRVLHSLWFLASNPDAGNPGTWPGSVFLALQGPRGCLSQKEAVSPPPSPGPVSFETPVTAGGVTKSKPHAIPGKL